MAIRERRSTQGLNEAAALGMIFEGTATATGEHFFSVLVESLARALGTYGASRLELGRLALPVALGFATAKAALIVLFFMHLRHHGGGARAAVMVAVTFVLLLMGLVLGDVGLRGPPSSPGAGLPGATSHDGALPR